LDVHCNDHFKLTTPTRHNSIIAELSRVVGVNIAHNVPPQWWRRPLYDVLCYSGRSYRLFSERN